jgi:glycosyltransferase involved in cell wall biosynthesis
MKLLNVTPYYYPSVGGGQQHLKAISDRLAARGHEVMVVTLRVGVSSLRVDFSLPRHERIHGVDVHRLDPNETLPRLFAAFLRLPGAWRIMKRLMSSEQIRMVLDGPWISEIVPYLLRLRPDIVMVLGWHYPSLVFPFALLKPLLGFRLVGVPLFHVEEPWSASPLHHYLVSRCDALLPNTDFEKIFIERIPGCPPVVHTVGVGIDPATLSGADGQRVRHRYGLQGRPVVGYVGRLQVGKGVVILLKAMGLVWRDLPEARLMLAGRRFERNSSADIPIEQALAALTREERARVVHIDGFEEGEKASIFDAFDVFAMPSVAESFGIAYLEAWLQKKPVIGARIGATACVIRDGIDGLLVDPASPADVARGIVRLLRDPAERQCMGNAGYQKTVGHFTWDRAVDQVERTFTTLLEQPSI